MVGPFPPIGPLLRLAVHELHIAATGNQDQIKALGHLGALPRPWDPATCRDPDLRRELWAWLDDVITWLNIEYTWDTTAVLPACWPHHPHLVHEVAVLADQRRRAGAALTSDALEEWHRYTLPGFLDRARSRFRDHCDSGHQPWPGKGRYTRHTSDPAYDDREHTYARDVATLTPGPGRRPGPHLAVVDLTTGVLDNGGRPPDGRH